MSWLQRLFGRDKAYRARDFRGRKRFRDDYRENEKTKFRAVPLPLSEQEALPESTGSVVE